MNGEAHLGAYSAVQSQEAVSTHLNTKQILPFAFGE